MFDLPYVYQGAKAQRQTGAGDSAAARSASNIKARVRMLSGCMDSQTSADAFNLFRDKNASGALTWALLTTLKQHDYKVTWLKLMEDIRMHLKKQKMTQVSQLSSSTVLEKGEMFTVVRKPEVDPSAEMLSDGMPSSYTGHVSSNASASVGATGKIASGTSLASAGTLAGLSSPPLTSNGVAPASATISATTSHVQSIVSNITSTMYLKPSEPPRKKLALLIGINYARDPAAKLNGCVNDTNYVKRMLKETYGFADNDIYHLTDPVQPGSAAPTKANIVNHLRKMVEFARREGPCDLFLEYSGHGSQIEDDDGDEEDGMDEALVPLDYQNAGVITDDWLYKEFACQLPASCRLTVLMDCCHSGTMLDLPHVYQSGKITNKKAQVDADNEIVELKAQIRMISGCMDSQTSADAFNLFRDKNASGALTWALLTCLKNSSHKVSWVKLLNQLRDQLKRQKMSQIAQLSSTEPITAEEDFAITLKASDPSAPQGVSPSTAAATALFTPVSAPTTHSTTMSNMTEQFNNQLQVNVPQPSASSVLAQYGMSSTQHVIQPSVQAVHPKPSANSNSMLSHFSSHQYSSTAPTSMSSMPPSNTSVMSGMSLYPPSMSAGSGNGNMAGGKKMALLIGINYSRDPSAKLNGCVNDTNYVRRMLKEQFKFRDDEIVVLTDPSQPGGSMPTKANILRNLQKIVERATNEGYTDFFLEYSGHGSQMDDEDGDEEDGMDEVLVPVDYANAGMITDDDLLDNFVMKLPAGTRLTVLMDCCHSGTMLDLPYKYAGGKFTKEKKQASIKADVCMLSGCMDSQTSADAFNLFRDKNASGALTWALLTTLKQANFKLPWVKVIDNIRALLKREKMAQVAELTSSRPIHVDDMFQICPF
jgi:hypothetical protein